MRWAGIFLIWFSILAAENSWEVKTQEGFSATAVFSKEKLVLWDDLDLILTLTYPKGYQPDLEKIRMNLFQAMSGIEIPFTIQSETINTPQNVTGDLLTQTAAFKLNPQISGEYPLTFLDMTFHTSPYTEESSKTLFSPVVWVKVTGFSPSFFIYQLPLMTLSLQAPVELSPSNKKKMAFTAELQEKEALKNQQRFQKKTFPWCVVIIFTLAIMYSIFFNIKEKQNNY